MLVSVETARVVLQYLSEMRTRPRQTASAATGNSGRQAFSEEHKCDASLTKQLLLRLHMKDSMLCSSAVQHLIIRIRSLISTCSVAVWYNCTEAELFQPLTSSGSGLAVLARFLGIGSGFLWFWELLPLVLGAAFFGCGSGFLWYWERLSFVLSSLVAFELSECSVAASGICVFSFVTASAIAAVISFLSAFGLSECSVAASLLLEFLLARVGNLLGRFLSSRAASGIGVAPPDELGGLQHLSLQSALILSSSICVNNVSETM